MNKQTLFTIMGLLCIALLLSSCSSSTQTPAITTLPQEQTPAPSVTTPSETQTTTPSESTTPTVTNVTQVESTPVEETPVITGVTASELALHNSKTDCWVVYKNVTYDVTKYLPKHPGGTLAISKHCGTLNFEKAFKGQHGTSKEKTLVSNSVNMGDYIG